MGQAVNTGHRLRDAHVEQATAVVRRVPIVIIGGGPSGLSAAWWLERAGERRFVVLDLERRAGGTSTFGEDGIVPYPWGAHYVPWPSAENRPLRRLFEEMGVWSEDLGPRLSVATERALVREPEERLFFEGAWHEGLYPSAGATARDREELARFQREVDRYVAFRDERGRRAFTLPVSECSDATELRALDRMSAATWLNEQGLHSPRLRWWLEYGCRDDYGVTLEQASAWALLFYHAARVPEPGAASAPFLTWPEGNGRIVRHLSGVVGERLATRQLVTDVVPSEQGVELSVWDESGGALVRYVAEHVIVAVPKFIAQRVLRPWREHPPAVLQRLTYGAWMVANLHLKSRPRSVGAPLAWDNVLYDSPSLGYVVATHQALRDRGPTIWTYYLPLLHDDPKAARRELLSADHRSLCDVVLSDLAPAHPDLHSAVERVDVWRWGHAMLRPLPGVLRDPARLDLGSTLGSRVALAHSDSSGLALFEEAQAAGVRAAEQVLERLRRGA